MRLRHAVLMVLLALCYVSAFPLSGKLHKADMKCVLPFDFSSSAGIVANKKVDAFCDSVNRFLDRPNGRNTGRPDEIKFHPVYGNIRFGNHRIWFHWGFNTDFKKFQPLHDKINASVSRGYVSETDLPGFWTLLSQIVGKRNRSMMNHCKEIFGQDLRREQANAIVTVLVSVHILGDYGTDVVYPLQSLERLYADVFRAIDNLAGKNENNIAQAKKLKKKLNTAKDKGGHQAFLTEMKREFSGYFLSLSGSGYDYKSKFTNLGYVLK